jgi:hypothetical protein
MSHLTIAVSESAFKKVFAGIRDAFTFSHSRSRTFARFTASYEVAFHLEGGTVDFRDDNTIAIKELDIKWDTLKLTLGFDIPEICVGGFCIIPKPFGGCLVRAPRYCIFSANPDVSLTLDLSGLITSEVSLTVRPVTKYRIDPGRTAAMSDLDAEDAGVPNKWQLFLDTVTVDVDVFDVADIVGDLIENAVDSVVNGALGPLPQWAKDLVLTILGPLDDVVRAILDIPDDVGEWLSDLLGVSLGLFNTITNAVADHFARKKPLEFEDPYPILDAKPTVPLIPVKIPIRDLTVRVNTDEMVLEAKVGA